MIRHAKAEDFAMDDSSRRLTEKGRNQAEKVGHFLKKNDLAPDLTLASPYLRAKETAEVLCASAGISAPSLQPWLACGMRPTAAISELVAYDAFQRVAIVGHEPDFSYLAEWLLGGQAGGIHARKASMILFSHVRPPSQGAFLEMVVPISVV
ncbi:MAG: histidine phosphatase family protein [Verrucomicrobiae bacterium]|nr:histidine phosphatase family protein [Verrucomicrobiae bacterium]NNJ41943.1 phosphohistidine phosphatase [Akkermansiaceae bacterium]